MTPAATAGHDYSTRRSTCLPTTWAYEDRGGEPDDDNQPTDERESTTARLHALQGNVDAASSRRVRLFRNSAREAESQRLVEADRVRRLGRAHDGKSRARYGGDGRVGSG